jgi:aryl-alcohol dehydrogenase-like predicted oxidoreductase
MIPGRATPSGTAEYAARVKGADPRHWRQTLNLLLSSVGVGTYLGNPDPVTDSKYTSAILRALELGINVIDTAINYRFQQSERAIGQALHKAIRGGSLRREHLLLCTKGGFISGDATPPSGTWFEQTFVGPGVVERTDVVADCHCMAPGYLRHELEQSLENLGVGTIDIYYVHNPETQLPEVGPDEYYRRLTDAFRALEEAAAEGKIQWYGTATWDAYRSIESSPSYASLERTVTCAVTAGGNHHRFKAIQLPFNLGMLEAYGLASQKRSGRDMAALEAASDMGLAVFTSVPLFQTRLLGRVPKELHASFPGLRTDAQRCLQFARSAPGVAAPLCGMKEPRHVEENAEVAAVPPLTPEEFKALFEKA